MFEQSASSITVSALCIEQGIELLSQCSNMILLVCHYSYIRIWTSFVALIMCFVNCLQFISGRYFIMF